MNSIRLRIPASTSNLGPGFDTLGLALTLYLELEAHSSLGRIEIMANDVPAHYDRPLKAMVKKAASLLYQQAKIKPFGATLRFSNSIPVARGLGSSAAFRLGTLLAINRLAGGPLADEALVGLACKLEHHSENSVASFYGGLSASGMFRDEVKLVRGVVPDKLKFVAAIPEAPIETAFARKVVPITLSRKNAVHNIQRSVMLFHALSCAPELLCPEMFEDQIHQPARSRLFPPFPAVIRAAVKAGARGAFLSGSGSTIVAVVLDQDPDKIGRSMKRVLEKMNFPSRLMILKADNTGTYEY